MVDESGSMNREHEWLLIMISLLEQALVEAGEHVKYTTTTDSIEIICTLMKVLVLGQGTDIVWLVLAVL